MAKNPVILEIVGNNAESVTGSATSIKTKEHYYLFECGMIQDGHTPLENYRLNCKMLQRIKVKDLEYLIVGHNHMDHIGLIPSLYEKGKCNAKIIVPKGSVPILIEMWYDGAYINQRDVDSINRKGDKNYEPLYTEIGIKDALSHILELESNKIIQITDELSIRYSNAGHILLSKQTEVYINNGSHTRKILFTSDLGNVATQDSRVFVEQFEPVTSCNIVIGECTYSARGRGITKNTYKTDVQKIKSVVWQYCIDSQNRVLIPTFSLDRMPYILWILYQLFGQDKNFKVPILVDSPLSNRLLDCYGNILDGDLKDKFDEMMSWKNIKRIISPEESKTAIADCGAKIICSSSGMITAGRSVKWAQSVLPRTNDCLLFIGYCGTDTLGYKIKHERDNKTININGVPYKNKCQIVSLNSFSSHMQRQDLINYYKSINCEKIYLVHSDNDSKVDFKNDLQDAIFDCLKTTKVVAVNRSTKISL